MTSAFEPNRTCIKGPEAETDAETLCDHMASTVANGLPRPSGYYSFIVQVLLYFHRNRSQLNTISTVCRRTQAHTHTVPLICQTFLLFGSSEMFHIISSQATERKFLATPVCECEETCFLHSANKVQICVQWKVEEIV